MNPKELLQAVGDAMREPDAWDDERWQQLSAGELSETEKTELLRAAGADAELAERAFAPLDAAELESLRRRFRRGRRPGWRRRPPWLLMALGSGAVAAAAMALVWIVPEPATLPAYQLEITGGEKRLRDAGAPSATPLALAPDSYLVMRFRPERRVTGPVGVRGFLRGAASRRLELPVQVKATGTLVIEGRSRELFGAARGVARVVLYVGAPGDLPRQWVARPPPGVQMFSREMRFTE